MSTLDVAVPASDQARADAELANSVAMWRAAQTVCARVSDPDARTELLGALGLLDVQCPVSMRTIVLP